MRHNKVEITRRERNLFTVSVNDAFVGSFKLKGEGDNIYAETVEAWDHNPAVGLKVHDFVLMQRAGGDPKHLAFDRINSELIYVVIGGRTMGTLNRIAKELWQASDRLNSWLNERYPNRLVKQLSLATYKDDIARAVRSL